MLLLPECLACYLFSICFLSSLTHLCPPVEFLRGRAGVGARGVAESLLPHSAGKTGGRLARGGEDGRGWGCCPLPRGAVCTPAQPGAERSGAELLRSISSGGGSGGCAGPGRSGRAAGWSWESGSPVCLRILSGRALPFLPPWKTSRRACRRARSFQRGQHFSSCPTWQPGPQGRSSRGAERRSWVGRSARAAGTILSCEVCSFPLLSIFFF